MISTNISIITSFHGCVHFCKFLSYLDDEYLPSLHCNSQYCSHPHYYPYFQHPHHHPHYYPYFQHPHHHPHYSPTTILTTAPPPSSLQPHHHPHYSPTTILTTAPPPSSLQPHHQPHYSPTTILTTAPPQQTTRTF